MKHKILGCVERLCVQGMMPTVSCCSSGVGAWTAQASIAVIRSSTAAGCVVSDSQEREGGRAAGEEGAEEEADAAGWGRGCSSRLMKCRCHTSGGFTPSYGHMIL